MDKLLHPLLGVLLGLILFASLVAFASFITQDEISYFEIDGMPCVEIERGISCDWSKWEGEK